MTSDGEALFRAICAQPADDTARLVYADWLEENGQPERAEFIRLQCEAWTLCPAYPTVEAARTRALELSREHGDRWYSELPAPKWVTWSALFVRGFIDSAAIAAEVDVVSRVNLLFESAPLRHLSLDPFDLKQLESLLTMLYIGRLATLRFPRYERHGDRYETKNYTRKHRELLAAAASRWPNTQFIYPPTQG
jgi:uncharacterized protein (TIGR02996 family)